MMFILFTLYYFPLFTDDDGDDDVTVADGSGLTYTMIGTAIGAYYKTDHQLDEHEFRSGGGSFHSHLGNSRGMKIS